MRKKQSDETLQTMELIGSVFKQHLAPVREDLTEIRADVREIRARLEDNESGVKEVAADIAVLKARREVRGDNGRVLGRVLLAGAALCGLAMVAVAFVGLAALDVDPVALLEALTKLWT